MAMWWSKLLFAHWPVDAELLRPHIPPMLEVDTFDGSAWIAIVPFTMTGVRARLTPALPGPGAFHELNVRTYVIHKGEPGVWFFSLDAANRLAVETARLTFHLAYFNARMSLREQGGSIGYESARTDQRGHSARLDCSYRATGDFAIPKPGSLESFLTSRYRLFASELPPREPRRVWVGEIDHEPWQLSPAECEVRDNTMCESLSIETPIDGAHLMVAKALHVHAWWPKRVE
ncbi:MAG: YqjF family protein [Phycisphaerales bacterium]